MSRRLIDIENATLSWSEEDAVAYGDGFAGGVLYALDKLSEAPTIDAVPLEVWKQTAWERDIAIGQLEEHGISFGCIAPNVIKLPCKIGDKVWIARRYKCHKRPRWGIVSEMFFTDDMELCIVAKGVARGKWGVDVFATYEEAEEQIKRNSRKD